MDTFVYTFVATSPNTAQQNTPKYLFKHMVYRNSFLI